MPRSIRENVRVGKPFILIRYPLIKGTSRLNMASTIELSYGVFKLDKKKTFLSSSKHSENLNFFTVHSGKIQNFGIFAGW